MRKILILSVLLLSSLCGYSVGYQTIGNLEYVVDTVDHYKVGPGTTYTRMHYIHKTTPLWVYIYEVELNNPYVKVKAETSTGLMKGMEQISSIAKRKSTETSMYFAGINGDFYNTTTGEPINGFATERIVGTVPVSYRPCFAISADGVPFIDVMSFSGSLKAGSSSFNIAKTNAARGANELALYNYLQGATTGTNQYGTELLLELVEGDWLLNSGVKKAKIVKKEDGIGNMAISANHVVLSGNGTAKAFLDAINEGDIVELKTDMLLTSTPSELESLSEIIGGSEHRMLKDGKLNEPNWAELHPRTAVGFNADKSRAYFAVVDGRSGLSAGVTTHTFGEIFLRVGVSDALNLDGGGSSGMYINKYGIVNRGSDGTERRVSNGLFAVSTAPYEKEVASIGFTVGHIELPISSTIKPTVVGYDKYGNLIETDLPATFSAPTSLGTIDTAKGFIASGSSTGGKLTAIYNGITADIPVSVVDGGIISLKRDSVLLDTKIEYNVEVLAQLNENLYPIDAEALTWTVTDPSVCNIKEGIVSGLSAGRTFLVGEFKGVKDTLLVIVQPVVDNPYIQTDFQNSGDFKLTTSSSNLKNITFNSDNLPENWNHGTRLNFTYTRGRYSSLVLQYLPKLYSLPDSISLTFNTGNSSILSCDLVLLTNNEKQVKSVSFANPVAGQEVTYFCNLKTLYPNLSLDSYPINLMNFSLSVDDSKHVANTAYDIFLKDIKLYYSGYASGIEESIYESGKISISPNPVKDGYAVLNFESENVNPLRVDIFSISGQLYKTVELDVDESSRYVLPVADLAKGLYLVSVTQKEGVRETVKLIIE